KLETIRKKRTYLKTRAVERFCSGTNRSARLGGHGRAAIIFEVADLNFSKIFERDAAQRHGGGTWVAIVGSSHHFEQHPQISDGARHRSDNPQKRKRTYRIRVMSGGRDAPGSGFQTADAAEMCGHTDRSSSIATHSSSGTTGRDCRRLPAARSACGALQVPGIIGAAIEKIVSFPRHQQLGRVVHA